MDKNLKNTHVQFKSQFQNVFIKLPISTTLAGRSFHSRITVTMAVRRFNLQFVVVIGPGTF